MSLQMAQFCAFLWLFSFALGCPVSGAGIFTPITGSSSTSHAKLAIGPSHRHTLLKLLSPTCEVGMWNWVCLSWMGVEKMRTALGDAGAQSHWPLPSGGPQARNWGPEVGVSEAEQKEASVTWGSVSSRTPHPPTSYTVETLMKWRTGQERGLQLQKRCWEN